MLRVKDITANGNRVDEADVVKRNPLVAKRVPAAFAQKDTVVVDDYEDDIDTLQGKINARGRADELRRRGVDRARKLSDLADICSAHIQPLYDLAKSLLAAGAREASEKAFALADTLAEISPSEEDIAKVASSVRSPIHVGDPVTKDPSYAGRRAAWS